MQETIGEERDVNREGGGANNTEVVQENTLFYIYTNNTYTMHITSYMTPALSMISTRVID